MEIKELYVAARSATILLEDGGLYRTQRPYRLTLNGEAAGEADTAVKTICGLWPDTRYTLCAYEDDQEIGRIAFHTAKECCTLDVRRFGAVGDGAHDDTAAIQAAITCCPKHGRVLIPAGEYSVLPLFLKSHIRLEIQRGATLRLKTDRSLFPILPGLTQTTDETDEFNLGSWEGNPLDMYAAMLTGVDVKDVVIFGEGVLDGCAQEGDWWVNQKQRRGAWRGRMLFLCRCKDIVVQGLTFRNSPAWNLHPYFSERLKFLNVTVTAPSNSPNTDGFDPESCKEVLLAGARFSLGDDCIAIKSGKLYMGQKLHTPCENIEIAHCEMADGHGGVTIGSEMAGGVRNVTVHDCMMRKTDRGLRIKTRRGRGRFGVVDQIVFERVVMEQVAAPLVVNCLYFCDADGHSEYVQSREAQPADERTPRVGRVAFRHVQATDASCAAYILGLPEQPVEEIELSDVQIACAEDAPAIQPAMADGVPQCVRQGIVACDVKKLTLRHVHLTGHTGARTSCAGVDELDDDMDR